MGAHHQKHRSLGICGLHSRLSAAVVGADMAAGHARQMVGMDQRRIVQGIMERLARERGFNL